MLKRIQLFAVLLLLSAGPAIAQNDPGLFQQQQQSSPAGDPCQGLDPANCAPQQGVNPNSYGVSPSAGGQGGYTGELSGQAGRSGYQSLTQPTYRDENALPSQGRYPSGSAVYAPPQPLTEFQKFVADTTGQLLPIFGSRLFQNAPTTFSPIDQVPAPASGTVGPGDLLRVRVWGSVNFSADLRVDRTGEVYLPQVGPVHVAGLAYSALDKQMETAIGRIYRNFQVSVQLGQIRSIQVYLVGRARRPGTYTVSSLSSLVDAVFAGGGPSVDGSLRDIQLKRGGKLIANLDLYDLLVNGDKSSDVTLQSGDVIYIPPVGPQVAVLGSVKTPAIYEERTQTGATETIKEALMQAAGPTNVASGMQLTLERLGQQGRSVQQVALTPVGLATPLHDGDILRVEPKAPVYEKTITLRGNTANAGRYAWHPGMRLSSLIPERAALLTRNYWWQKTRLGLPSPEFEREPSLSTRVQPSGPQTLPITSADQQRQQLRQKQARTNAAQRRLQSGQQGSTAQASPLGEYTQSAPLSSESEGRVRSADELPYDESSDQQTVGTSGQTVEQRAAAEDAARARHDVVTENTARAQSVTNVALPAPEIDWKYAVIERLDPRTLKTSLVPFDLGKLVLDHDASQDLELQPGDVVTVFSQADIHVPIEQQTRLIRLEGEFVHSGVYSVKPGETLRELVVRAGGLSPGAYLFGSEFDRASVRAAQQKQLDAYIQTVQLQIDRGILATSSSATSSVADLASANAAGNQARDLVQKLRQIRATGRIVLNLHAFSEGSESLPTLNLEDGDSFYVPSKPNNVSVIGAVYDQNSFIYKVGGHVRDYEEMAGGANRNADKHHPFVVRADGSVVSQDQVGEKKFKAVIIQPGDTIVVSEKTFGPSKLRNFLDFSQLFSQLAVGGAVLGTVL